MVRMPAGGSDSSCYALMADAFAAGTLQPTSDLVTQVPWPDAPRTFHARGLRRFRSAARGVGARLRARLLVAARAARDGRWSDAIFILTPVAGALLVWLTFLAGRRIAGPLAGAMAAVLLSASPPMLYQVVQPMNDVTTAALWMGTFVALLARRWTVAGLCCGLALLVRPNLLPLAAIAAVFVIADRRATRVAEPIP
jgi:hypothetical protein